MIDFKFDFTPFHRARDKSGKLIYSWPYSAKCPRCGEETLGESIVCSNCGFSGEQKQCPRCKQWMHHEYLDGKEQCSLYCDREDERNRLAEESRKRWKDYHDVSTYPMQLQGLAKLFFDEYIETDFGKDDFISFLWKLRSAA